MDRNDFTILDVFSVCLSIPILQTFLRYHHYLSTHHLPIISFHLRIIKRWLLLLFWFEINNTTKSVTNSLFFFVLDTIGLSYEMFYLSPLLDSLCILPVEPSQHTKRIANAITNWFFFFFSRITALDTLLLSSSIM